MNTVRTPKGFFLGQLIRDVITGVQGRATILSRSVDDAWHITIQPPPNKRGEKENRINVSENRCVAVNVEHVMEEPVFDEPTFELLQPVIGRLTRVKGEIRDVDYHITGCIRYNVKSADVNTFGTINSFYYAADEIERDGPAVSAPIAPQRRSPEPPVQPSIRNQLMHAGAPEDLLRGCPVDC